MATYTPYLLLPVEAEILMFFRAYVAAKFPRGSQGPFDGISAADMPTVAASPEVMTLLHTLLIKVDEMSDTNSAIAAELTMLRDDITQQSTVIASTTTLLLGLATQLRNAEAAAKDKGATDAQLEVLKTVRAGVEANTSQLAAAITANTPAVNAQTTGTATNAPSGVIVDTTTGTTTTTGTGPGTGTNTGSGPALVIPNTDIVTGINDAPAPGTAGTITGTASAEQSPESAPSPDQPLTPDRESNVERPSNT